MATRNTTQQLEDTIAKRSDQRIYFSSASHCLVFGNRSSDFDKHWMAQDQYSAAHECSMRPWIPHHAKGFMKIITSEFKSKILVTLEMQEKKGLPLLLGRNCLCDLRFLLCQRCIRESHQIESHGRQHSGRSIDKNLLYLKQRLVA